MRRKTTTVQVRPRTSGASLRRTTSMDTGSTNVVPVFGVGSMAQSAGLLEIAVRLCLNQRKHLCPHLWVPILKPSRPCIRPASPEQESSDLLPQIYLGPPFFCDLLDDEDDDERLTPPLRNKRVVFADSKGLSLTAVRLFSEEEDQGDLELLPSLQGLGLAAEDGYSCTVSTCCPGTQLKLGFPLPSADFKAFRAKLAESMVTLEHCTVTEFSLKGTARVRNLDFHKEVSVRITFDSWQSFRDVPCLYVQERYGGPQTDIFHFDIAVPKVLDAKRRIEFCLSYTPGGRAGTFWDNNNGENYGISVCVGSHLCHGRNLRERSSRSDMIHI